jgi:tetratricopeptide (TPR) repeat protein
MAIKTEKELSEPQRALWLKALAAMELRNLGYAISLLQGILRQEPEFLTGRELLRRAEVTKQKAAKKSFFNISTAPIAVMKAQREIKKEPRRAIEMVEKVLEEEPYHRQANLVLKEAAVAAGWPEIGVFALRTMLEVDPNDMKVLHELAALYRELGQNDHEVEIYNRISEIDPMNAEAQRRGKDAAARASMTTGGWTQAQSYRDLIKDKEAAISLEQRSRIQLAGESLDREIAEAQARQKSEPRNVDVAKRLGSLFEQKDDFESAIASYENALNLIGTNDPVLARKISDLRMRRFDHEIAELEEFLSTHQATDKGYAAKTSQLQAARSKRAEILIEQARDRVERNPTDSQLRFELGQHLSNGQRYREAVPELQRARQNPNARLKAMNLLGVCYRELGMLDLAVKQFEEAAREIVTMDAVKKEIVYNLGLAFEEMGEREKAVACLKQIYEVDYGFKDVAERVESSYRSNTKSA